LNYYELLDIPHDSDKSAIKKSYFKLAKEFHPDKFASEKFEEIRGRANKIFSKIANAYQILSDDILRAKYDKGAKTEEEEEQITKANKVLAAEMQFQKGTTYLNNKRFDKALETFQWAIKLNPDEAEYHLYMAIAILENPKKDSAEDKFEVKGILEKVILMNANLDEAHFYLAKVYKLENNLDVAEKHFHRALTINPKNIDAQRELRLIEMRKKKKGFIKSLFK
jgi:tetratricopeptide (TPR) repeat protein